MTVWLRVAHAEPAHFNSHAHVERDGRRNAGVSFENISTHTLTWSVTGKFGGEIQLRDHFNSHAHVERDTNARPVSVEGMISTHTLTWSVTNRSLMT